MRALVLAPFSDAGLERLSRRGEVVHESWLVSGRLQDPEELGRRLDDEGCDVLVVESDFVLAETIALAPGLRFVGVCRGALNQVDLEAARAHGVAVSHAPGRNAVAVAELAVGLLLTLLRRLAAAATYVRDGSWQDPTSAYLELRGREIAGATVGVVGYGRIGRALVRRLVGLGARVLVSDPAASARRVAGAGAALVPLAPLLRRSDAVCLVAGGGAIILGERELAIMKPGAYLVQTGDPAALDYAALTAALAQRRLAGAALDVFPGYPLPAADPLLKLDNVLLTPHIGGATAETVARHSRMIAGEIERWLDGRPRRYAAV
jgi:D-3-phosphoglycerate dehydrogenase